MLFEVNMQLANLDRDEITTRGHAIVPEDHAQVLDAIGFEGLPGMACRSTRSPRMRKRRKAHAHGWGASSIGVRRTTRSTRGACGCSPMP